MVGDSIDHLRVQNDGIECDEIGDEQSNLIAFVEDIEQRLLAIRDVSQPKLHDQRIFVRLLNQPVAECVENLDRAPDNLKDLLFGQQLTQVIQSVRPMPPGRR